MLPGPAHSPDASFAMDLSRSLHHLAAPLRADTISGASEVAGMAAEALARGAEEGVAGTAGELRAALAGLGLGILDAQPAMAPLVALVSEVLDAILPAGDLCAARAAARSAALGFRDRLGARAGELAERTAAILPEDAVVLTLSHSSAVREALIRRARRGRPEAIVLESRPLLEGRRLAAQLAGAGIPVTVAPDAAAAALVRRCSTVLLGADSVGDLGVVNKVGSAVVAQAAGRAGIPVIVSAGLAKLLPRGFPQDVADDRPDEEVMPATPGVGVWNRYFEVVPVEDVTWIVIESGALPPPELTRHRAVLSVSPEVRAWAERRRRDPPETQDRW